MELVSILVPIHNESSYIIECIQSIEVQSYPNYELIIVDDGSTDNSVEIIQDKAKNNSRIKLFKQEKLGVIAALNKAISVSKGKYIARIDGDDLMPKDRLKFQIEKLEQCGLKSIVTGKIEYFSDSPISEGYIEYQNWLNSLIEPEEYYRNQFVECVVAAPSMLMYKSDLVELGGYDENIYPEDFNLFLKALSRGIKIFSIPQKVLAWRDHNERSSKTLSFYKRDRFWDLRAKYLKLFISKHKIKNKMSIFGTGENGKYLLKALQKHNIVCDSFFDIDTNRIGGKYLGVKVLNIHDYKLNSSNYILVALREKKAQKEVIEFMNQLSKKIIDDYIFMC